MTGKFINRSSPKPDFAAMKRFGLWWQKYQQHQSKPTTDSKSRPKAA